MAHPLELPAEPREWFERNSHRQSWYGYTENFNQYPSVFLRFPPFEARTSCFEQDGWRMYFRQKTEFSTLYLHFTNKKNFGFRIRLPRRRYTSIHDMFQALYQNSDKITAESSSDAVTRCNNTPVVVVQRVTQVVREQKTFEDVMKDERARIMHVLGEWRPAKPTVKFDETVIDFAQYYPPSDVCPTAEVGEQLLKRIG